MFCLFPLLVQNFWVYMYPENAILGIYVPGVGIYVPCGYICSYYVVTKTTRLPFFSASDNFSSNKMVMFSNINPCKKLQARPRGGDPLELRFSLRKFFKYFMKKKNFENFGKFLKCFAFFLSLSKNQS